jgi:subtilisin family serine protease
MACNHLRTRCLIAGSGARWAGHGTSFATPQVSATIALMLEQNPRLTLQDVRRILEQNATRIGGVAVNDQGAGILELDRAVIAARRSR